MDLQPCDGCGERGFSGRSAVVIVDGVLCSRYTGSCRRCGLPREFTFRLPDEISLPVGPDVSFGGPEPSELLDPGEWLMVADLAAKGAADASDLRLAAAATDEAIKFIPETADRVPPEAIRSVDGQRIYAEDPGRFLRRRLEAVAATYRELASRFPSS
jgi:hypothetical protein